MESPVEDATQVPARGKEKTRGRKGSVPPIAHRVGRRQGETKKRLARGNTRR